MCSSPEALPAEKECPRCKKVKPKSEWYIAWRNGRGFNFQPYCKPCMSEASREREAKHKERVRRLGAANLRRRREFWTPEQRAAAQERDRLKKFWGRGLTEEGYEEMLRNQGGVCAICGRADMEGKRLAIDHCHETGRIRGLLCGKCNRGLGLLGDTEESVEKAVAYLRRRVPVPPPPQLALRV